jgi:hypothetical protein
VIKQEAVSKNEFRRYQKNNITEAKVKAATKRDINLMRKSKMGNETKASKPTNKQTNKAKQSKAKQSKKRTCE